MSSAQRSERRWMARMATVLFASAGLFVFACTSSFRTLGYGVVDDAGSPPPFVESSDAGEPDARAELTQYCPSNKCPAGRTTCPTSPFACDVDLRSDLRNCGACGLVCRTAGTANMKFDCVDGQCVSECSSNAAGIHYADCNGVIDDGCEVLLGTNENCNGCGDRCTDPKKPCVHIGDRPDNQCGCDPGHQYCPPPGPGLPASCSDPMLDDMNCGGCGVVCKPDDGALPRSNMYFGCAGGECGHEKCTSEYRDCDGVGANGCETHILSPDNCGACGKACDPGQTCIRNRNNVYECACPPGRTLCGDECIDILTDPRHCGSCSIDCLNNTPTVTGAAHCSFGSCKYGCAEGRGDCNGDSKDGCETNLLSDPRNCGACGNTCDLVAGQPCVLGGCVVEVCDGGVFTQ